MTLLLPCEGYKTNHIPLLCVTARQRFEGSNHVLQNSPSYTGTAAGALPPLGQSSGPHHLLVDGLRLSRARLARCTSRTAQIDLGGTKNPGPVPSTLPLHEAPEAAVLF